MLKLSLLASRQFTAINVVTAAFYGALAAAGYLLALQVPAHPRLHGNRGGAVLIPSSLIFLVLSAISGALVRRIGPPAQERRDPRRSRRPRLAGLRTSRGT
jgi:hypothetical protein